MLRKFLSRSLHLVLLALIVIPSFDLSADTVTAEAELVFLSHLELGMPEQDVLMADEAGKLWRIAPEDSLSLLSQPIYASTTGAEHDPFRLSESSLGVFEMGEPLGFTLGDWLAAEGTGLYTAIEDYGVMSADFSNLVPNGVYTMWCSAVSVPPNFEIVNKPCGESDGTQNMFVADSDGSASFSLEIGRKQPSTNEILSVFAIVYHSDGKTYGENPGVFGMNAHTQLIAVLPQRFNQ